MQIHGLPLSPHTAPSSGAGAADGQAFLRMLGEQLEQVNQQHQKADHHVRQLALGQAEDIHDVVLNVAQADLMFRMVLEVRNRLIESYQEVMRMQI